MAAVLLWDISDHSKRFSAKVQSWLFGTKFERLGQSRRVEVLRGLELIDDSACSLFRSVGGIRNHYLHLLSRSHEQIAADAQISYRDTMAIVKLILGPSFEDGKVKFREDLYNYLVERGVLTEVEPEGHV